MHIVSNTTDFSSQFLYGMLDWVARQVKYPVGMIADVKFTRTRRACIGRAYGQKRSILIRIGASGSFPILRAHAGIESKIDDQLEALTFVAAHEIRHLHQDWVERLRPRQHRERPAEEAAAKVLKKFRDRRAGLLDQWGSPAVNT